MRFKNRRVRKSPSNPAPDDDPESGPRQVIIGDRADGSFANIYHEPASENGSKSKCGELLNNWVRTPEPVARDEGFRKCEGSGCFEGDDDTGDAAGEDEPPAREVDYGD